MNKIAITGCGINTEDFPSLGFLCENEIESIGFKNYIDEDELFKKQISFQNINKVKREDRSLLNNIAKLSIDSAVEAFSIAEHDRKFSDDEKQSFKTYIASESVENNFNAVERFTHENLDSEGNVDWYMLGQMKRYLNPLDMLRLLSTNSLYHVAKTLGLNGGGYPIRRMSLSGLIAFEDAYLSILNDSSKALVIGTGDLKTLENMSTFKKMSLLKTKNKENGIIPSFGSASIVLESIRDNDFQRKIYAEVIKVFSTFIPSNQIKSEHWKKLYQTLPEEINNKLNIIAYDNGVKDLYEEEYKALDMIFPKANIFNYKKIFGYTGKANTLVDLVTALSDKRIPVGDYILINGVGFSVGIGYILVQKKANI